MTAADFPAATWVRSTLSLANGNCVEVAALPGMILLRDSKRGPGSPVIAVTPAAWRTFSDSLKAHRGFAPTRRGMRVRAGVCADGQGLA